MTNLNFFNKKEEVKKSFFRPQIIVPLLFLSTIATTFWAGTTYIKNNPREIEPVYVVWHVYPNNPYIVKKYQYK